MGGGSSAQRLVDKLRAFRTAGIHYEASQTEKPGAPFVRLSFGGGVSL